MTHVAIVVVLFATCLAEVKQVDAVGGIKTASTGIPAYFPYPTQQAEIWASTTTLNGSTGISFSNSSSVSNSSNSPINYGCCQQPDSWGRCDLPTPLLSTIFNGSVGVHEYVVWGRAGQSWVSDFFVTVEATSNTTTFQFLVVDLDQYFKYEGDQSFYYYPEVSAVGSGWLTCAFRHGRITMDQWAAKVLLIWHDSTGQANPEYRIAVANGATGSSGNLILFVVATLMVWFY